MFCPTVEPSRRDSSYSMLPAASSLFPRYNSAVPVRCIGLL